MSLRPRRMLSALDLPHEVCARRWTRGGEVRLTMATSGVVLSAYEASNRRLEERIGRDLGVYGYFPSSSPR